jgi:D-alanyl-D-alanine carboxypeptidase (penicillin-binding protein 5/6)
VKAWSGILIDRRSGAVLWAKNSTRRLQPASCTKIMTALIVLDRVKNLGAYARVPDIPYPQTVGIGLRFGDRITVWQAMRALMVRSANDAALTLATYVGGSEPAFVKLMNAQAARMGLKNTHFVNCRGKPRTGQYSSAADLATLGLLAMRDSRFRSLVRIKQTVIRYPPAHAVTVETHNRLLLKYAWADGIKTGSTSLSKMVLVGSGKPGLVPLIVVTMHEPNRDQEVRDAVALFKWGSALYDPSP